MTLLIIGAGLSRTGTVSLMLALEHLGVSPCYHSENSLSSPTAWRLWERALDGQSIDWDDIFNNFLATTDIPGCLFYRELAQKYPSSKVILSLRDPNAWFDSTRAILSPVHISAMKSFPSWPMWEKTLRTAFGDDFDDRESVIAAYKRHNAEVRRSIPADRLLVYEIAEGWEPICKFLRVPVPELPFPKVNSKEDVVDLSRNPAFIHELLEDIHAGRPIKECRNRYLRIR